MQADELVYSVGSLSLASIDTNYIEEMEEEILDAGSVSSKQLKDLLSHHMIRKDVFREL